MFNGFIHLIKLIALFLTLFEMSKNKLGITQLESISSTSSSTSTISSSVTPIITNNNAVVTDEVRIILEEIVHNQLESMRSQTNQSVTNHQTNNHHNNDHQTDVKPIYSMKDMSKDLYADNKDDAEYVLSYLSTIIAFFTCNPCVNTCLFHHFSKSRDFRVQKYNGRLLWLMIISWMLFGLIILGVIGDVVYNVYFKE